MKTMALTRPTELRACRVRLTTGPAAAAEARSRVRAAIRAWDVPVDPDIAVLLTSDVVTDAIRHEPGGTVTLAVRCRPGRLRVDVQGTSCSWPTAADARPGTGTVPGLVLLASLSAEWGVYRTTVGHAVYFTLAFQPGFGPVRSIC